MPMLRWERAGEDAGIAGGGVTEDRVARGAEREEIGEEVAFLRLGPAERVGEDE